MGVDIKLHIEYSDSKSDFWHYDRTILLNRYYTVFGIFGIRNIDNVRLMQNIKINAPKDKALVTPICSEQVYYCLFSDLLRYNYEYEALDRNGMSYDYNDVYIQNIKPEIIDVLTKIMERRNVKTNEVRVIIEVDS